jgi:hypothetical protein
VSDVNETLQQLLTRRLREIGRARGRDTPISLNQLYNETPDYLASGERVISYEILRRVQKGTHSNLTGRAVRTLATMLGVPEGDVWQAAGRRAPAGRFELPERADRLNEAERLAVLSVVDAILNAGERPAEEGDATILIADQADESLGAGQPPQTDVPRARQARRPH